MIALLILLVVVVLLFSMSGNSRRARESQERLEKHVISQLPPPAGFEDCSAAVIRCLREANRIGAIQQYRKDTGKTDLAAAQRRIEELEAALRAGPALGRPPQGLLT